MNSPLTTIFSWVISLKNSIIDWVMMRIVSVRTILKSITRGIAQTRSPQYDFRNEKCPTCVECGCATYKTQRDHTFVIGGNEEVRSEPLVKATVVYNSSVFQCTNLKCGRYYMGPEAMQEFEPIHKVLTKSIKIYKRL